MINIYNFTFPHFILILLLVYKTQNTIDVVSSFSQRDSSIDSARALVEELRNVIDTLLDDLPPVPTNLVWGLLKVVIAGMLIFLMGVEGLFAYLNYYLFDAPIFKLGVINVLFYIGGLYLFGKCIKVAQSDEEDLEGLIVVNKTLDAILFIAHTIVSVALTLLSHYLMISFLYGVFFG